MEKKSTKEDAKIKGKLEFSYKISYYFWYKKSRNSNWKKQKGFVFILKFLKKITLMARAGIKDNI